MTGIGKLYISGSQIQNAHPRGNKHTRLIVFTELLVCLCENIVYRHTAFRQILKDGFGGHHKHSGGDSLAGNIGGQKCHRGIAQLIKIIEIAAHLFCGDHLGIDAVIIAAGEVGGKCGKLDLLGIFQFLVNTRRRLRNIPLQRGDGSVDIIRQRGKLLVGAHIHRNAQVSLRDPRKGIVDFFQVIDDNALDEDVDKHEQRCENKHLHKNAGIEGRVAHKHGFLLRHSRNDAVAFHVFENIGVPTANKDQAAADIEAEEFVGTEHKCSTKVSAASTWRMTVDINIADEPKFFNDFGSCILATKKNTLAQDYSDGSMQLYLKKDRSLVFKLDKNGERHTYRAPNGTTNKLTFIFENDGAGGYMGQVIFGNGHEEVFQILASENAELHDITHIWSSLGTGISVDIKFEELTTQGLFVGCTDLKAINVNSENKSFSSIDGVLYNKNGNHIIRFPRAVETKIFPTM